jgi:glycerophosphoryl diester phosphodiesterase
VNLLRSGRRPLVIGHRGAAAVAPENTLESLRAAVAAGADHVEFDIGPDLRLAHSAQEVPESHVTLDSALDYLKAQGVGVHLDVKEPGYEEPVVAALRRHGLLTNAVFATAYALSSRRLGQLAPDVPRAISYPRDRYGVSHLRWPGVVTRSGAAALRAAFPGRLPLLLNSARADTLSLHHTLCSRSAVRLAHRRGVPVLAWTANDPDAVRRLEELGVDAIVSDDPGMALATLRSP